MRRAWTDEQIDPTVGLTVELREKVRGADEFVSIWDHQDAAMWAGLRFEMSALKTSNVEFRNSFSFWLDAAPMEARSAEALPDEPEQWQFEPKWDGFRCLVFEDGGTVELRGKSGKSLSRYFPEVMATLVDVPFERFVVDGELVVELNGRFTFDALQARLHPAESRIHRLSLDTPARLILFDMLIGPDGSSVRALPLTERRHALEGFGEKAAIAGKLIVTPARVIAPKQHNGLKILIATEETGLSPRGSTEST
jgi:ATP-dependent DNA ligase